MKNSTPLLSFVIFLIIAILISAIVPAPALGQISPEDVTPPPPEALPWEADRDGNHLASRLDDGQTVGPGWLEAEVNPEGSLDPYGPNQAAQYATAVAAGSNHTCVLTDVGGVRCWGDNYLGQLGDGTRTFRQMPVDVIGLNAGVVAISASHNHTCALTAQGTVKCWGYNRHGELGNNTTVNQLAPATVQGLDERAIKIAVGGFHSCALLSDKTVRCWGANWHGQIGDGSTKQRITPVFVKNLENGVRTIVAGKYHTCAIITNWDVKCWGYNRYGQQGNGGTVDNKIPRKAINLGTGVDAIAAGELHTCAVTKNDRTKCWGDNSYGQLGNGIDIFSKIPVRIPVLDDQVANLSLGNFHSCALTKTEGIKCWGDNWAGQLGDGSNDSSHRPVSVLGMGTQVIALETGADHTCGLRRGGVTICWGANKYGQVGDTQNAIRMEPVPVVNLPAGTSKIRGGGAHACTVTDQGTVWCWGNNQYGQLGDGTTSTRLAPVEVAGLSNVRHIALGTFHTCAVHHNGLMRCWGDNSDGQLGINDVTIDYSTTPRLVQELNASVVAASAGGQHTCAQTSTGGVKCWGKNSVGRLGDGTNINRLTPVDVVGLSSGVSDLQVGENHSCVLLESGGVKCWGYNNNGQLGDGTKTDRWTPVNVSGLGSGVVALTTGTGHSCVLVGSETVKCWGSNNSGQLGDGTTTTRLVPVTVTNLPPSVMDIWAQGQHTCAATQTGEIWCWGDNWSGQLGDGSTMPRSTPGAVIGLPAQPLDVGGGGSFNCASLTSGGPVCWGSNSRGQVGDGTEPWRTTAVSVFGVQPARLNLSDATGQPGSTFVIQGINFLPSGSVEIAINGVVLTPSLAIDPQGRFDFILDSGAAEEGGFILAVQGLRRASTRIDLSAGAEQHLGSGLAPIYHIPPGIAHTQDGYLPFNQLHH